MKKISLLLLPLYVTTSLYASELETLYSLYTQKQYAKACHLGLKIFNRYKKNSKFLMLYGFSCLRSDYIDRLAVPMTGLRHTKTERANASYFATIILQKKLLYHALLDNVDITHLRLPKTDYILSEVFDMYTRKEYKKVDDKYYFNSKKRPQMLYVLYCEYGKGAPKMVIEERLDNHLLKKHRYW
ncbi:hypothetical protein [Hydrogenimonas urashimensis]|uniref:hypothetical protein n=1 Tax=Hydrogenimonas urashimensis TaxID=2740515 RepID=UPI00191594CF|nr:hypothetical protein [Hydrogenimonas urashimensis]